MKAVGIKKVHYCDNEGNMVTENVKNMVSIYLSRATINKSEHLDKLLKNNLPSSMKQINFNNFIKFNFVSYLSSYSYKMEKINGIRTSYIYNTKSQKIASLQVIN